MMLGLLTASAAAQVRCDGDSCGDKLVAAGWQRLASCSGHAWSYLLARDRKVVICRGISAIDGPRERPCDDFSGDIERYRALAAQPDHDTRPETDCWQIGGR
jgi:hypothetical protein